MNILNKQSRTADKRWSFSLVVRRGANNSSSQNKLVLLRNEYMRIGPGMILWCDLSNEKMGPLGRPKRRREDNIKMDLEEVGRGCGDWMELAQDRDMWRVLVNTSMNVRVP